MDGPTRRLCGTYLLPLLQTLPVAISANELVPFLCTVPGHIEAGMVGIIRIHQRFLRKVMFRELPSICYRIPELDVAIAGFALMLNTKF